MHAIGLFHPVIYTTFRHGLYLMHHGWACTFPNSGPLNLFLRCTPNRFAFGW